jgi:hypothetical protein
MRYMIMHKSNAHWETGAAPEPELVARVGALIGELAKEGRLLAGEGLRPTSQGARLRFVKDECTVTDGPFTESKEMIAGFAILRLNSLQEAIELSKRFRAVLRADVEIDIRPVCEAWDIGLAPRPEGLTTTRYMCMHRYLDPGDACRTLPPEQMAEMGAYLGELVGNGTLLAGEGLDASAKGALIRAGAHGKADVVVMDGPFTESKEVLGGFVIINADSLEEAISWGKRYFGIVVTDEVHVRLVAEGPPAE